MVAGIFLLWILFSLSSPVSAAEPEHWRSVKGAALQSLFKDKEFADGVHFAYQFKAGGTFTGTEMSKKYAARGASGKTSSAGNGYARQARKSATGCSRTARTCG